MIGAFTYLLDRDGSTVPLHVELPGGVLDAEQILLRNAAGQIVVPTAAERAEITSVLRLLSEIIGDRNLSPAGLGLDLRSALWDVAGVETRLTGQLEFLVSDVTRGADRPLSQLVTDLGDNLVETTQLFLGLTVAAALTGGTALPLIVGGAIGVLDRLADDLREQQAEELKLVAARIAAAWLTSDYAAAIEAELGTVALSTTMPDSVAIGAIPGIETILVTDDVEAPPTLSRDMLTALQSTLIGLEFASRSVDLLINLALQLEGRDYTPDGPDFVSLLSLAEFESGIGSKLGSTSLAYAVQMAQLVNVVDALTGLEGLESGLQAIAAAADRSMADLYLTPEDLGAVEAQVRGLATGGTGEADVFLGSSDDDLIEAGAGHDTIILQNFDVSRDTVEGGAGDDTVRVIGSGDLAPGGLTERADGSFVFRYGPDDRGEVTLEDVEWLELEDITTGRTDRIELVPSAGIYLLYADRPFFALRNDTFFSANIHSVMGGDAVLGDASRLVGYSWASDRDWRYDAPNFVSMTFNATGDLEVFGNPGFFGSPYANPDEPFSRGLLSPYHSDRLTAFSIMSQVVEPGTSGHGFQNGFTHSAYQFEFPATFAERAAATPQSIAATYVPGVGTVVAMPEYMPAQTFDDGPVLTSVFSRIGPVPDMDTYLLPAYSNLLAYFESFFPDSPANEARALEWQDYFLSAEWEWGPPDGFLYPVSDGVNTATSLPGPTGYATDLTTAPGGALVALFGLDRSIFAAAETLPLTYRDHVVIYGGVGAGPLPQTYQDTIDWPDGTVYALPFGYAFSALAYSSDGVLFGFGYQFHDGPVPAGASGWEDILPAGPHPVPVSHGLYEIDLLTGQVEHITSTYIDDSQLRDYYLQDIPEFAALLPLDPIEYADIRERLSGFEVQRDLLLTGTAADIREKLAGPPAPAGNSAPVLTIEDVTVDHDQTLALADFVSIFDADGDAITSFEVWEQGPLHHVRIADHFTPANRGVAFADLDQVFVAGRSVSESSTKPLWLRASDGAEWGDWTEFQLSLRYVPNTPPVVTVDAQSLAPLEWVRLSDIMTVTDAQADEITQFRVWDNTGSNSWWIDGAFVEATNATGGYIFPAASLGSVWIQADAEASWQTLFIRANDGRDWGVSEAFQVITQAPEMPNAAPVATIGPQTVAPGQWTRLADVLSVVDADDDAIETYFLRDTEGAMNWWADGGLIDPLEGFHSTGDLAGIWFRGDTGASEQTLGVRVFDGTDWSDWADFTLVTQSTNSAPVIEVRDQRLAPDAWRELLPVLSFADADGDAITAVQLWDDDGVQSWWADGGRIDALSGYSVERLEDIWFAADAVAGTQTLWVRASDGTDWSAWEAFEVETVAQNEAPVVTLSDQTLAAGAWTDLATMISVFDPDGDAITRYELWDDTGGPNWWANGRMVDATSGHTVDALDDVWFRGNDAEGSEVLWVRASDGLAWSEWSAFVLQTPAPAAPPIATVDDQMTSAFGWTELSGVLEYSDANGDALAGLQLWDDEGPPNWWVNGVLVDASRGYLAAPHDDIWLLADESDTVQTLYIRATDGALWSEWDSFSFTTQGPAAPPVITIEDQSALASAWIRLADILSFGDANPGRPIALELWDQEGGDNWWVGGAGYVDASAGYATSNVEDVWVQADAAYSVQQLWVRADDGSGRGPGNWTPFDLTSLSPDPVAPVVVVADQSVAVNDWIKLTDILEFSDHNGDSIAALQVFDDTGMDNWWSDGSHIDADPAATVASADDVWIQGDAAAGVQTLWLRANDGTFWSDWDMFDLTTV